MRRCESKFYRPARYATLLVAILFPVHGQIPALGFFEGQNDIGTVLHSGSGDFDPAAKTYTLTASGENIWGTADAFHFMWKQMSGDVSIDAAIALAGQAGDPHRKAVLMIRQSLDADSAYADIAVHGNGLTSLQFRDEKGSATHEIQSAHSAPRRVKLEKHGDRFYMFIADRDEQPQFAGGSMRVVLQAPFYVGIGVCAHNKDDIQKALFSNVGVTNQVSTAAAHYTTIQTIAVASTDSHVSYVAARRLAAPSVGADGNPPPFESVGKTEEPAEAPEEARSPDGQYIYKSLTRSGATQIWRMSADGSNPEQLTHDEDANNAFPRPSPDGKQLVFLTYPKTYATPPEKTDVVLRDLSLTDNKIKVLAKIVGGKDTLGTQPWGLNSQWFYFASYQTLP